VTCAPGAIPGTRAKNKRITPAGTVSHWASRGRRETPGEQILQILRGLTPPARLVITGARPPIIPSSILVWLLQSLCSRGRLRDGVKRFLVNLCSHRFAMLIPVRGPSVRGGGGSRAVLGDLLMNSPHRREFLRDVGRGALAATVGAGLAADLGLGTLQADEAPQALHFGKLEPLVALLQETPPGKLLPLLVQRLRDGTSLQELVAAGALANARTFGGEDYVGFHTVMALAPSFHMSKELPREQAPLIVLKVLYRNANRITERGGRKNEVLKQVRPGKLPEGDPDRELLAQVKRKDKQAAEQTFAALATGTPEDMLNHVLSVVEDNQDVHRVVLPYRAYDLLPIVGKEHAHTLLRQSVRFCAHHETPNISRYGDEARALLPKLFDQYKLPRRTPGTRTADDAWVDRMSQTIFTGTPAQAAEALAAALAEGFSPDALGEALSLAVNQLVLRDNGRPKDEAPNKPAGSVHGDGIGVHACDSANAWRNLARVGNARHAAACMILGAYQACRDRSNRGGDFLGWEPYPRLEARERVKAKDPQGLLREAEGAIRNRDQGLACAAVAAYGALGEPARPVFDLLLKYAVSEDGALHAEKYYRTCTEEFALLRPAFRWRQLVALARVTASEYGQKAPGHEEARRLLKV
jgi:hypothetical protein